MKKKKFSPKVILGQPAKKSVPTMQEVAEVARQAIIPDLQKMLQSMGDRITHLYTEETKTAVILNSLAEILIMKGVISKEELQKLVTTNQDILQKNYKQAAERMRKAAEEPKDGKPKPEEPPKDVAPASPQGGGQPETPK